MERPRSIRQRPETLWNGSGARKSCFGSVLRARGRHQDGPGNVQGASWRLPGHPRDNFGCSSDASVAPCIVQTPPGSDFRRFCFVVQNPPCASRTTFYYVLLLLDEENSERVERTPNLEIAWFSASKIDPKTVRGPKIATGRFCSSGTLRKLCEKFIRAGDEVSRTASRATKVRLPSDPRTPRPREPRERGMCRSIGI